MTVNNQDPTAIRDWTEDWTSSLGAATISTATVTAPVIPTGASIVASSNTTTSVTFRLNVSGVAAPAWVGVKIHIVMSTGEEDQRTFWVQVTNR